MKPKMENEQINYYRIARAIEYLKSNFQQQPSLEEVADYVHLSPFHFQRMFTDWAGVSPKKFLQYLSIEYAKRMLRGDRNIFDAAHETGLSGTGRLHDLFVNISGMTPGEYKNGGVSLQINYSYAESPFGNVLVASTAKGVCYMGFADDKDEALMQLRSMFPAATYNQMLDRIQQHALYIFTQDWSKLDQIKLHLKGTEFQLQVWEALIKIPMGRLTTYQQIASTVARPGASRAVGTAVGSNPVAFLIPCHRVIRATGALGEYMWGANRKTAMIAWEASKLDLE